MAGPLPIRSALGPSALGLAPPRRATDLGPLQCGLPPRPLTHWPGSRFPPALGREGLAFCRAVKAAPDGGDAPSSCPVGTCSSGPAVRPGPQPQEAVTTRTRMGAEHAGDRTGSIQGAQASVHLHLRRSGISPPHLRPLGQLHSQAPPVAMLCIPPLPNLARRERGVLPNHLSLSLSLSLDELSHEAFLTSTSSSHSAHRPHVPCDSKQYRPSAASPTVGPPAASTK